MTDATAADDMQYIPSARVQRRYTVKKTLELLAYASTGLFMVWYGWPAITGAPSLDLEYLMAVVALLVVFVGLGFVFVVTWNQRLPRIENGRMTWPFPFMRESGVRTRYIALDEITDAELVSGPANRRGADLTLRDGTRLFLPETVFGVDYSELLQILVRYVRERSVPDPGGSPDRG